MRIFVCLLMLMTMVLAMPVEEMYEEVGQKIFHQHVNYIIFVSRTGESPAQSFNEYCEKAEHGCAFMFPSIDEFQVFTKFMNIPYDSYYLILDVPKRMKYVLKQPPTVENLQTFYQQFTLNRLQPFYASDPIPSSQAYPHCTQLVGQTIFPFITNPDRDAVVFFYADRSVCQECIDYLETYRALAKRLHTDTFVFGAINRLTNEHPSVRQEDVPAVVVYFRDGSTQKIERFDEQELEFKLTQAANWGAREEL